MLTGKFLCTLVAIIMAILAICNLDFSQPLVENWMGMSQQTVTAMPYVQRPDGAKSAISGNYFDPNSMRGSGKFVSVPSFQGILSPRFSNVQYGANIRYNMPDRENLAAPCEPLTFGDMAKENYLPEQRAPRKVPVISKENYSSCGSGQCGASDGQSCGKAGYGIGHQVAGGYELPVGYTNGNYADIYNKDLTYNGGEAPVVSTPCGDSSTADLPVGTMSSMDSNGVPEQFVMYNRLMNVNLTGSRLRSQGDPIRGDLAITPCQQGWFSVYPVVNRDLQAGAMNVLAGAGAGESNAKLMDLLINASGGARTTFGGADLSPSELAQNRVNMTPMAYNSLSQATGGNVTVSSFP